MSASLINLIEETYNKAAASGDYPATLLSILKEKHYWPSIKIKKFKNNNFLCLLHNSYKRDDINEYKELYDECRSIVLDFSRSIGNNIVISYANSIPIRLSIDNYLNGIYEPTDKCYFAMDGTLITCYYHNDKWYFGSSCCPDINSSKFSHPTKTHGYMLDEVLYEIYKNKVDVNDPNISLTLRNLFTSNLSPLFSYEFVLIHHENKHIVDYSSEYGENYKFLFHINTKLRITLIEEDIESQPLSYLGIKYSPKFTSTQEGIAFLINNNYGVIVKKNNKVYKITSDKTLHIEEVNANNYNIWYNMIYVYMLQKSNYNINEYKNEFLSHLEIPENTYENVNLVFTIIRDVLYNLYISTTNYYPKYKRFKTNMDIDRTLNPVIRFHLAQLRSLQIKKYTKAIITQDDVFNYICHSNNIKNIKKLIFHFSTTKIYNIPDNIIETFKTLNQLLK